MKNTPRRLAAALLMAAVLMTAAGCGSPQAASSSQQSTSAAEVSAASESTTSDSRFTDRDLEQSPDLSKATEMTVSDGKTLSITKAGIYRITGTASDATISVDAADDAKVQLVLDGVSVTNSSARPFM